MKISDFDENKYGGGKSDFFELIDGDNKVRIVSEFAERYSHFENNKYLGSCAQNENCEFCNRGVKPSIKFLCHVIDRSDNSFKLAQFGAMILKQLRQFSLDSQYGFDIVPKWDCNIKKSGKGLETQYVVLPDRGDTALTAEEQKVISELKAPVLVVDAMNKKKGSNESVKSTNSNVEEVKEITVDDIPF